MTRSAVLGVLAFLVALGGCAARDQSSPDESVGGAGPGAGAGAGGGAKASASASGTTGQGGAGGGATGTGGGATTGAGGGCDSASCPDGCCSPDGCLLGTQDIACGISGQACQDCMQQALSCVGQACIKQQPCNAQSCPKGCCKGFSCELGFSDQACGNGGAACKDCSAQSLACVNGLCTN